MYPLRIFVAGSFTSSATMAIPSIARVKPDGERNRCHHATPSEGHSICKKFVASKCGVTKTMYTINSTTARTVTTTEKRADSRITEEINNGEGHEETNRCTDHRHSWIKKMRVTAQCKRNGRRCDQKFH